MYIALFSSTRIALAFAKRVVPIAAKHQLLKNGEIALLKLEATEEAFEYVRALHALHGTASFARKTATRYKEGSLPNPNQTLKQIVKEAVRQGAYITPLPTPEGDFPPHLISSLPGRWIDQAAFKGYNQQSIRN